MYYILLVFGLLIGSSSLFGQSHDSIDRSRKIYGKTLFVDQGIKGVFGSLSKKAATESEPISTRGNNSWRGFGLKNGVGIELLKFTQLSLSHTLVNVRSEDTSLEHMEGSELAASIAFSFSSPIGNLVFGSSIHGANYSYQSVDKSSSFVGAGHNLSGALNYFVNSSISVFGNAEKTYGNYSRTGGNSGLESLSTDFSSIGLGVKIWM